MRMTRAVALVVALSAGVLVAGCDADRLGPPNPTGATDIGGPTVTSMPAPPPGFTVKEVAPQSQQQAQDTLLGYVKRTLQALPAGYALDANRFGGTASGNVGCDDNATGPEAPTRFNTAGDLKVPPGVDYAKVAGAFGDVWRKWGWFVYEDDGFRKPNQFGVSPDGYRLRVVASAVAGYPPGFEGSSPCFPGQLARDDVAFPTVVDAG
jgi:hypothetical protein